MAFLRLPIQFTPEYSAISKPVSPTVVRCCIAVFTVFFSVLARLGSLMLLTMRLISSVSRSGFEASTNPTVAKETIRMGISDKKEK